MMRIILKSLCLGVFFCSLTFGKSFLIKGDSISYGHQSKILDASGNVKVYYKDIIVHSDNIHYDHQGQYLSVPGYVDIKSKNHDIKAKDVHYYMDTYRGEAHHLDAQIDRLKITGEKMIISPQRITIKNASFTTCDTESDSHYIAHARTIIIFPQFGYFIALHNRIETTALPFDLYFPTFLYGSRHYGLLGSSSLIPEVGSNRTEGAYIHQKIGYFKSSRSSGHYFLGYSTYLGTMGGISHVYSPSKSQDIHAKWYYVGNDGFEGRLAYHINLLEEQEKKTSNVLDNAWNEFTSASNLPLSSFSVIVQHREVINDRRVNYSPLFQFRTNKFPLNDHGLSLTLNSNFGKIAEEKSYPNPNSSTDDIWTFQAWRSLINTTLAQPISVNDSYRINSELRYFGRWYDTGQAWNRLFGYGSIKFNTFLNPKLSYTKELASNGFALFEYEDRYVIESDELGLEIEDVYSRVYYKVQSNYGVGTDSLRRLDFTLGLMFHCWKTSVKWISQQGSINFGVEIF